MANTCKENGLPECCTELVSLIFSYTPPQLADKQEVMHDYATGYLLDFTEDRFSKWMQMFESHDGDCAMRQTVKEIQASSGWLIIFETVFFCSGGEVGG